MSFQVKLNLRVPVIILFGFGLIKNNIVLFYNNLGFLLVKEEPL